MNSDQKIGLAVLIGAISLIVVAVLLRPSAPSSQQRIPSSQTTFTAAVTSARSAFQSAPNELSHEAIRKSRKQAICQALLDQNASDWIGEISAISTTSSGAAVLSVKLAPNVHVQTWNNAFSDAGSKTLIQPSTQLFTSLVPLKKGDTVQFSGKFEVSDKDCVREQSITLAGSMLAPEFTMKFTEVRKL